jgi:hypothetical protein
VDLMVGQRIRRETYGHEVFDLGDAVFVGEARDEDVCGGPVKLLAADVVGDRRDLKAAALGVVEKRAENAGGIEIGGTVPVDGAVHADQSDGAHVADDAVVFDGLIRHAIILRGSYGLTV